MLAYAPGRRRIAQRQSSPNAMLIVLCAHILGIAALMSVKMDLPGRIFDPPTVVVSVPLPHDPPPNPAPAPHTPDSTPSTDIDHRTDVVPTVTNRDIPIDLGGTDEVVSIGGGGNVAIPSIPLPPPLLPVSTTAKLLTPESDLKPPYPQSKLLADEEAALKLRLMIDAQGRVVAVEPVGHADPVFLAAARRHLMGHWRYKPATEGGRPISSSIVITLLFQLDG